MPGDERFNLRLNIHVWSTVPEQKRLIAELKSAQPALLFPICLRGMPPIGDLMPVTNQLAGTDEVVECIYRWRRMHMSSFLTVFEPTIEKTKTYLNNYVLSDASRILFLVRDIDAKLVGNIGLCNVDHDGAELDNVIRGEACRHTTIMLDAQRTLLNWAFTELQVPFVYLHVLADNSRAIRAYQRAGFVVVRNVPLSRQCTDDGYRLVPASVDGAPADAWLVRMEIARSAFDTTERRQM